MLTASAPSAAGSVGAAVGGASEDAAAAAGATSGEDGATVGGFAFTSGVWTPSAGAAAAARVAVPAAALTDECSTAA